MLHSSQESIEPTKGKYLISLLIAMSNITNNDYGIEPLLGKGAIKQFSTLFSAQYAINQLVPEDHRMIC